VVDSTVLAISVLLTHIMVQETKQLQNTEVSFSNSVLAGFQTLQIAIG